MSLKNAINISKCPFKTIYSTLIKSCILDEICHSRDTLLDLKRMTFQIGIRRGGANRVPRRQNGDKSSKIARRNRRLVHSNKAVFLQ